MSVVVIYILSSILLPITFFLTNGFKNIKRQKPWSYLKNPDGAATSLTIISIAPLINTIVCIFLMFVLIGAAIEFLAYDV